MTEAEQKQEWSKLKPKEFEEKVLELAKKNMTPDKIGLILRDQHGIPRAKIYGKRISQILKEHGLPTTKEHDPLVKRHERLSKHTNKHKHDYTAKRAATEYAGRIHKIKKRLSKK